MVYGVNSNIILGKDESGARFFVWAGYRRDGSRGNMGAVVPWGLSPWLGVCGSPGLSPWLAVCVPLVCCLRPPGLRGGTIGTVPLAWRLWLTGSVPLVSDRVCPPGFLVWSLGLSPWLH